MRGLTDEQARQRTTASELTLGGLVEHVSRTEVHLDVSQPLPEAPWFEPGERRSARRVSLHVVAGTAQHAGHADILRGSLDGQKTMG